jgi:hypothetical protein
MKTNCFKLALLVALAMPCLTSYAITNTTIAVSGTNLVLSWPSHGYESYLIQYRQTLDATDAWTTLANAYPANSTNRTTFTLYGIVPPPNTNNGTGGGGGGAPLPNGFSAGSLSARHGGTAVPLVMPADGSGAAVPLALYPPGLDLSDFVILDPATGQWLNGSGHTSALAARPMGGASPMDADEDDVEVATGFYRVFHIPDWLVSLDGYTFDGPTFLPVDFAEPDAPTNYVDDLTLLINGQPFDDVQFIPYDINGTTYWGLGIYFDRLPNGTNTIQLLTTVRQSDELSDQTPYMTFSNAPQTIVIGNTISFTNWNDLILSNSYVMNAQSSVTNVDWEIDIYDVNGAFVNSQTGHSDDGNISWTWDLTDYNGNSRNDDGDPFFYPYLTITQDSGDAMQSNGVHPNGSGGNVTRPLGAAAEKFPSLGGWVVAYMDNFYSDGLTNFDASARTADMVSGINDIVGAAAEWNCPVQKFPIAYGRNYTQADRDTSWSNLASWLYYPQTRNFYYFGHGSANDIGGDYNVVDSSNNITGGNFFPNSKACLTSKMINQNIAANPSGVRPYRFVFLDGCDTANGNFAPAFGIPKETDGASWFFSESNAHNIRPCVFMGWNIAVGTGVHNGWGTVEQFWNFRKQWIADWLNINQEVGLNDAIDYAERNSSWADPNKIDGALVYYGDKELRYLQYNYGDDWPQ